ncbi:hypothetical protein GGC64_006820 [Mycobacterium sp. OAS707]|uniref:hypothetical protein n=1 Tax=Mycobacterium sp. OAS707 TaxID=2663822 RepID=UPI00178A1BC7|nr:hypothetical protein [Mycobacterium sp. OAS707]
MEPPHNYVHETSSSVVHHQNYLNHRNDQALCGLVLANAAPLDPTFRPAAVCPDCEARLVEYHVRWWREKAEAATAELEELRVRFRELTQPADDAQGTAQPSADEEPAVPAAEHGEPTPLLDQARKELVELCRRFDEAIPYFRLKNCMDAFSDKLTSEERVLLAEEIGAEGSLIRWCTKEIEGRGWQVTNNPVHSDADTMMDAWTEDYYQTPKKTKWRMGRSRSHEAS